jgi:hypothetical protein
MNRLAVWLTFSLLGVLALAALGAAFMTGGPAPACSTSTILEAWSPDRAYRASLLKKNCNKDESIFYSVRIEAHAPPLDRAWYSIHELDSDQYPIVAPTVKWPEGRQLKIVVETRTLKGELTVHTGSDLTIVKSYVPSNPDAFPNY